MTGKSRDPLVTLLVPTLNRPEFVARLLNYYAAQRFAGRIAIGDSSDTDRASKTHQVVATRSTTLDATWIPTPGLGLAATCYRLLAEVSTPYAAFLPDDDFLVPASLANCARFLAEHPSYAAAHGSGISVRLDSNGLRGNVLDCGFYPQPSLESDSAVERLRTHLANYTVSLFAVHRIETLRAMYADVHRVEDTSFAAEILPCCMTTILGKVKALNGLYVVRQAHDARLQLPTMFDWIATPVWYPSYQAVVDCLAQSLVEQDGCTLDVARKATKEGFRQYVGLGLGLRRDWGRHAGAVRVARRALGILEALRPKTVDQWSVPALLRPSSPHHADFLPVYQFLTTPPGGDPSQPVA